MPQVRSIQLRRDSSADWTQVDPILSAGEIGYEDNTGRVKIGDGVTRWTRLPYLFRSTYVVTIHGKTASNGVLTVSLGSDDAEFGVDGPGIPIPHNAQLVSWAAAFLSDSTPAGPWTVVVQRKRGTGTFESVATFQIEVS